ncbi:MAG: S-layer homology domain-containing protein [Megasphaera sp.]|uniref:S-layer homology domain-containing protein n=1 Tax=Megasphaera sp. TaxID=2023260 RepID=UPI0025C10F78|nr:S-layer homology domain-containing protein [Megasphaera sp.]MCI7600747.1 S-layer homology domain-containing protein [Megasphaera sp.]
MNGHNGGAIAIGHLSYSNGYQDIAIGDNAKTGRTGTEGEGYVAIGANSFSNVGPGVVGYDFQTNGKHTIQTDEDAAAWRSTNGAVSVGNVSDSDHTKWITRQITGVAAGFADTDAVNVAQLKAAISSVNPGGGSGTGGDGVHFYSVKETDSSKGNYNNEGATGTDALAAGVDAKAQGNYATAVGNNAQALKDNAVAIGNGAVANGTGATVIGQYAKATGDYATAFGGKHYYKNSDRKTGEVNLINEASGIASTAFGEGNKALGEASLAFGLNTQAGTETAGQQSVAFGEGTKALGGRSLAFGERTLASFTNSVAFGADTQARSNGATAFGSRTRALAQYSTAMGNRAVAAGNYAVAFGTDTIAGVKTDESGALTLINKTKIDSNGNIAYVDGQGKTYAVHDYSVDGGETHDYVVVTGTDGKQYIQDYRGNIHAVTIDDKGVATASTEGVNVTLNVAGPTSSAGYTLESYDNATAFGQQTKATNKNATAFGKNSEASGETATAFGEGSVAAAENSLAALGGTVVESAVNSAAIGNGAKATLADTVALGSGSVTTRAKYSALTDAKEKAAYAKDSSSKGSAWEATDNAIAVGNDSTVTRQITGVAAGSLDTDAVNVAQLKAVDAKHTTVSVGGQKATADDTLVKGGNLELKRHTTDGQANYDVALSKDVILGEQEENKGGSLTVNSVAQFRKAPGSKETYPVKEAVKIDGTTVSVVKNDGTNDQRQVVLGVGQDTGGYVALFDKTGNMPTYIFNAISPGITYLKDSKTYPADEANEFKRLEYGDITNGSTQFIATLDDGLKFSGDQGTDSAVKLNQKLTVTGGETNPDNLATASNIGVVSNGTDTLTVKLAKDLKDLNSVTTGKTVQNDSGITITNDANDETKNVVITGDKISFGGNQVTNMDSGINKVTNQYDITTNGANIGDVKNIASSTVQPVIDTVNKGWELDVNGTKQKTVTPDNPKVNLIQGQNITITGDTTNTDNVTIATADDVRFNTVRVGGSKTDTGSYTGGIVIGKQSGGASANPDENDYITGLKNTNWDSNKIQSGRAATEDQLKKVADDIKQGTVAGDVYVTGGEVTYHTDGGTDNGQPTVNDGTGKLTLTENNKTTKIEITGLHDYYVTNGTVTDDGKNLELTRNDRDENGNPQKISIDLGNVLKHDLHLVQNPAAGSDGKYKVDTKTGMVTLKVQNTDGTDASDITISGFEGLGKGLKFCANQKVEESGSNPVTNQLGSTINITGAGDKTLDKYSGKNLLTSVEQDAEGNTTIHVLMDKNISADSVVVGQEGKAGKDGKDGYIGINGKDGADGITTTILRTEKGQPGADGTNGKPGVDGKDITRIVYQNGQDGTDGKDTHTVATLDDGLQFAGDDGQNDASKVIAKKLNERLDIVGKAQGDLTDANIGVTKDDNGKLYIQLAKHVNLDQDGTLQAGDAKIGHFSNTELTTNKGNHPVDGSYTIGLDNKDWNVESPDYVSGRAATEDQLAKVSEAINNATTAAGKRTVVTVNDKSDPATAEPGANAYGEYDTQNGNLMIAAKRDSDGLMTYNIKLNDKLNLGKDGADGQEGTIGLTGKDGLPGADGKQGYSTTIIRTEKGQAGKDGKTGKENLGGTDITRIVYTDKDGSNSQTVATLDDGLKFVGNDGQEVTRKLNETLSIKGGLSKTDVANASSKNLGVRKNGDGLEIVMTDTPDFTKVTVGGNTKITIGEQTVTGKKADGSDADKPQTGNYITGLDNKAWDKDNIVENRAATEGQLRDVAGSITNQSQGGGFCLADEAGNTVKKDLGDTVTVKGDGKNIETKVNGGALEVSLKKDVDLGQDGSIKAGNTTINSDGVETNKVTVGDITITDQGINGGTKQITNIGSGIDGKQYADAKDNNAASIGDVKNIAGDEAGKAAEAVKSKSGKNITVKDDHTVNLNDNITLGDDQDKANQVAIDGNGAKVRAGDGANQVTVDGSKGQVTIGSGDKTLTLGKQANTAGDSNSAEGNYLNGLDNKKWDGEHIQSGRAATEDQLKTVSDKVNSGRVFQGDDGKEVKVGMGDTLKIQGGVKAEDVSQENNIGIVKGADDTLNIRLAKNLKGLDSVTTGNTTINNKGLTIKTSDDSRTITVQDGNVNMGGNTISGVADGKVSKDSTDAVNGSQLWQRDQAINGLSGSVNKLGNRINRVGAGAAALAALHPLDFDPDNKWDFAAGYGNYRGANAAAVGAYYRPNEDTMFSVGGSFGGGENMVNAGVSIKLGQGNHVSTSRVAMAKEMKAMRQHMAEQDALIAKLQSMHGMAVDPAKSTLFPDVAENHWAYQYVTTLAKKGILEGYPDGEFKGDRMMTRYEFAAIVYRIVESGVGSTDPELSKLVKEFSPELQYIRIDTIQKDRNGKPTIERVRVISDAK